MATQNALDHLILFLPADPATNLPKIPDFITKNFTLTPGGTHADGLTSNTLILLADGCYIELISFVPSAPPSGISSHWWSPFAASPGWADWCLTNALSPAANYASLTSTHQPPIHGGRKRADGVDVKWAVTFPAGENGGQASRGKIPFFCHDTTPRSVRVPLTPEKTTHPSGVLGVAALDVLVKDLAAFKEAQLVYDKLFGEPIEREGIAEWQATRVVPMPRLQEEVGGPWIQIRVARSEEEKERVRERGFWFGRVVLAAKAPERNDIGKKVRLDGGGDDLRGLWIEYVDV
ncbi:hypothetical protein BU23DRAFT_545575 [Bimuria novae-zelandiae CBS 107.79]|uniref:Glyoxalase-like domain-containing protein n=1 Tax=Bimuria novae-zelandiae CBS 107.79 TaxID=1447943 RepID=A0A6A5ULI0_9PLEO|nr:hypothetical protein BU23DRAFT_545575 [Bimuria novae-zelandiae CBS 107.79]